MNGFLKFFKDPLLITGAASLSLAQISLIVSIVAGSVAIIYSCLKIYEWIANEGWKKKRIEIV